MPRYLRSVDLGQLHDYTGISVSEWWTQRDAWLWTNAHPDEPPMIELRPDDFETKGSGDLVAPRRVPRRSTRSMSSQRSC